MGTSLSRLISTFKALHIAKMDGAGLVLKGVSVLAEQSDAPWTVIVEHLCPPPQVVEELLHTIQKRLPNRDIDTCAALALQHAYLKALQTTLIAKSRTFAAWNDLDHVALSEQERKKLTILIRKLYGQQIEALQINFRNLHSLPLIQEHFERLTTVWSATRLFRQTRNTHEARNFARRISYLMYPCLAEIITTYRQFYAPLTDYLQRVGYWGVPEIERYRADLMRLAAEPVLNETFALRDLYVELQASHITQVSQRFRYGGSDNQHEELYEKGNSGQLMQTVLDQLEDREHVVFVQATPGKGKTVFCQMLTARIATEYPDWLPVFVQLRDEQFDPKKPLEATIKEHLVSHLPLTDDFLQQRRILLILDGFDELHITGDTAPTLKHFFEQLSAFQNRCANDNRFRHKIVITGRPVRIQDIESNLPENFFRINIEQMEIPQVFAWLSNWTKLFGPKTAEAFRSFLEKRHVFQETDSIPPHSLQQIAAEPLSLYLLGKMYRYGIFSREKPESSFSPVALYDRLFSWICGGISQSSRLSHTMLILEKSGLSPTEFRKLLQEIAFCIWHERRAFIPFSHIVNYLSSADPGNAKKLMNSGIEGIYTPLISFSFHKQEGEQHVVGFSHKSFGEYLTAEKMVASLIQIGKSLSTSPDIPPDVSLKEAPHRFYSVFGVTLLTDEIWEFVMSILTTRLSHDELARMTDQLYGLYIEYSNGRWMNEDITRTQWGVLKRYEITLDLLQFEAQAGINLFVLLCLLYWKTGGHFDICGRKAEGTFDPNRFRKLLAIGELIGTFGLFRRVHHLLTRCRMPGANLLCANFRRANLQYADLQATVLRDANLRGTILQGANLQGADLRTASLQDADVRGANLQGANLEDCNLRDANLQNANLQNANLLCAELRDADLKGASLQQAVLYGANMQGTDFEQADLTGAIISQQQLLRDRHLFSETQIAHLNVVHD